MRTVVISQSNRTAKKYQASVGNKTIHFGATGYEDYTTHKDPERKARYLTRHKNENWDDPETAGFWARWVLWNKPSLKESVDDLNKRFKSLHVKLTVDEQKRLNR